MFAHLFNLFMYVNYFVCFFFLSLGLDYVIMSSTVRKNLRQLLIALIRFGLLSKTSGTEIHRAGSVLDHNIIIINTDKPL